jgi:hypothetical protein
MEVNIPTSIGRRLEEFFFENHHPDQQPDTVAVKTRDPPASHTMAVKDDEATKRRRKTA